MKAKLSEGMTLVVEHLPGKLKALSSNSSTAKKKRQKWSCTLFTYQKAQYWKNIISPRLIYRFNTLPVKIPAGFFFVETDKYNLKFI
jgi:hypothetical protein